MKSKLYKLSLITLVALSAIGIGIVVNASIKNYNIKISDVIVTNNENKINSDKNKKIKKKQQITQKQEALEKMWKIGYDQFFKQQYKQAIATERQVIKEDPNFYKAYSVEGIALAYSGNF